eukprot:1868463-Prymnesium_polylepis.1
MGGTFGGGAARAHRLRRHAPHSERRPSREARAKCPAAGRSRVTRAPAKLGASPSGLRER